MIEDVENKPKEISELDIEALIESVIFVSTSPISLEGIHEYLKYLQIEISLKNLKNALEKMTALWMNEQRSCGRGLSLKKMGNGYIFTTHLKNACFINKVVQNRPSSLSKAQIEALAIIAYRQPITRQNIDEIRGVDSGSAVKRLIEYDLIKILGKSEELGRPLLYGTTSYFLEFFSLTSLKDLPDLKQYEALGRSEASEISENMSPLILKDLLAKAEDAPMFSRKILKLSDEALKNLDEALIKMDLIKPLMKDNQ